MGAEKVDSFIHREQLHQAYTALPEGEYLSGRVRYDTYRPEHVDEKQWEDLLGIDVNNLEHMAISVQIARVFLKDSRIHGSPDHQFSPQDESDLLLAAAIHDWGEGVEGCEDINWNYKTTDDDLAENEAFSKLTPRVVASVTQDSDEAEYLYDQIDRVQNDVVFNRESRLGKAFNAIERVGYLRTGIRAWRISDTVADKAVRANLYQLSADVILNHAIVLARYADDYPAITQMMCQNHEVLYDALSNMPESTFDLYPADERKLKRDKFQKAKNAFLPQPQTMEVAVG